MGTCGASSSVRRTAALATVVCAGLLAGSAHAAEVENTVYGEITLLPSDATVVSELAAVGVVLGADVTLTWTVESTAVGEPHVTDPDVTVYHGSIVDVVLKVGSYEARCNGGLPAFVQIGDNTKTSSGTVSDNYAISATGTETSGRLLESQALPAYNFNLTLLDIKARASSDGGLIQDVTRYQLPFSSGAFGGIRGTVAYSLKTAPNTSRCRKGQLTAAGKLTGSLLKCMGKRAGRPPEKDPEGTSEAACLDKADNKFQSSFTKACEKAEKKGGNCLLPGSEAGSSNTTLRQDIHEITIDILFGADTASKFDRALRRKLLKFAASYCQGAFAAYAKDAAKQNSDKLQTRLGKSRNKLESKVGKALLKAQGKGVTYAGPTGPEIADAVSICVENFVALSRGQADE